MLKTVYEHWRNRSVDGLAAISEGFYPPMLAKEPVGWHEAQNRVMFIGQETREWGTGEQASIEVDSLQGFFAQGDSVEALQRVYEDFVSGEEQKSSRPFWRYFRQVKEAVQDRSGPTAMIFSNVVRCAFDGERDFTLLSLSEHDRGLYLSWQLGLLKAEIEELKPNLILLVSGPQYDDYVKMEFDDLTKSPMPGFEEAQFSKFSSSYLTGPTYRTYHPKHLIMSPHKIKFRTLSAAIDDAFRVV